jgi:hypothetical protein
MLSRALKSFGEDKIILVKSSFSFVSNLRAFFSDAHMALISHYCTTVFQTKLLEDANILLKH